MRTGRTWIETVGEVTSLETISYIQSSLTLHRERKGPPWPTSVALDTGTSLREAVMTVLSTTRSGTDVSDIPAISRRALCTKTCRHVRGSVCERCGEDRERSERR